MTNQLQQTVQVISPALVKAQMNLSLLKKFSNWQKLLQEAENIAFDKNNLKEDYEPLKKLRLMIAELKESYKQGKKPHWDNGKVWDNTSKEVIAPFEEILNRKVSEFSLLAEENRREKAKEDAERNRIASIKQAISKFLNDTTIAISMADDDGIVQIQKKIGSEKSRESFYQEFLDDFKTACDGLTPIINKRKELLRKDEKLKEKESAASSEDELMNIKNQREDLKDELSENVLRFQEKAFEQFLNIDIVVPESTIDEVRARHTSWKWKIDDIDLLHKKMKHLTEIVPVKDKIDELLKTKKSDGSLDGKDEEKFFGITFYLEKTY